MVAYVVDQIDPIMIEGVDALKSMDLMSPFVWPARSGGYRMMVRAVPNPLGPDDPTGVVYGARSADGLAFTAEPAPAIAPGPWEPDAGGVEDPTVVVTDQGLVIFYTGVDGARSQGALLVATGPDESHLEKRHVALQAPPGEGNIKEATIVQTPAGDWRLFYEYAQDRASRIGIARADKLGGDWVSLDDPFTVRADGWDNWHLSTGPIVQPPGEDPVMFYNGATKDARWRIGWISFSPDYSRVTGRGIEPVLVPPPDIERASTDIAFAASAICEDGGVSLWYSIDDKTLLRAMIAVYK